MKPVFLIIILLFSRSLRSQERLTLQECYQRAEMNYPLVKQRDLISRARALSIENVYRTSLPQISVAGQATYQSDVTNVPIEAPGLVPLSKDQYRIYGEISQTLYHGGMVDERVALEETRHDIDGYSLKVELYQLRGRINELYFGILLSRDQIAQSKISRSDLTAALSKLEASIANGTALQTSADVVRAEILRIDQRMIEIQSVSERYRKMLSLFLNTPVAEDAELERPVFGAVEEESARPELQLFDAQLRSIERSERALTAGKKPRIDLFVQAGYGRPGLNMLDNTFTPYYLGGIRFSWLLSGYYTLGRERQILQIKRQTIASGKDAFVFNNDMLAGEQEEEISRLLKLLEVDDSIITLRGKVRATSAVQLEQGILTPTDFVRDVNAEDAAKQSRALHETQLLLAQAKLRFIIGQP